MNALQKRRFKTLIEVVDATPRKDFNMSSLLHVCGSPACALGYYAAHRKFTAPFRRTYVEYLDGHKEYEALNDWFLSAETHFGLTADETVQLFDFSGCGGARTPKQVAKYLRKFLAAKEAT